MSEGCADTVNELAAGSFLNKVDVADLDRMVTLRCLVEELREILEK